MYEIYGSDTISVSQGKRWSQRFWSANYSLEDEPRPGRLQEIDDDLLQKIVEQNPKVTVEKIAKQLQSTHSTDHQHLQKIDKVSKLGQWVLYESLVVSLRQRIAVCDSHLCRLEKESFLNRVVTDDKNGLCNNIKRRRQWVSRNKTPAPQPKEGLHPRKLMLSVWWDMDGVIHGWSYPLRAATSQPNHHKGTVLSTTGPATAIRSIKEASTGQQKRCHFSSRQCQVSYGMRNALKTEAV